jgi:hypothetical protein
MTSAEHKKLIEIDDKMLNDEFVSDEEKEDRKILIKKFIKECNNEWDESLNK